MRKTFIKTLTELVDKDNRVYLLTADMGYGLVETFADKYPDRFINVGVAEQNMIGVATGLALSGKIVFCYSISNFPTLRCLEQIRNNVCYHNARVHIVAGGTGLNYGALGTTHHATEDIAVMRSLPNMKVIAPCDKDEAELATIAMYNSKSPCYMRCDYSDKVYSLGSFHIGKSSTLISGSDVCLIATGGMVATTMEAANKLIQSGVKPLVLNMSTIKPIDSEAIIIASKVANLIVTIEEHNIIGGLGSAVAEVIADNSLRVMLIRMGIPDVYYTKAGNRTEILRHFGLTADDIVKRILNVR